MIHNYTRIDEDILLVKKSIDKNLRNADKFVSDSVDTAQTGIELKPPVPLRECKFIFDKSSYVAKCCRILAKDIILNKLSLINDTGDSDLDGVVGKIQDNLIENINELFNMLIDYYYAGIGVCEYSYGTRNFTLKQIPVNTIKIIRIQYQGQEYYLLKQQIQTKTNYFKIMGEDYPSSFTTYDNETLGDCAVLGGDNFYTFFSTPLWLQEQDKILTEIAISNRNYRTITNGNIADGILHINMEPQLMKPVEYDAENNPVATKSREETILEELQSTDSGIAVTFTESNRPLNFDFIKIENDNYSYLEALQDKAEQATLNCYNIPLARLMINTEKESMNSNKTQSIWEIYTLDLRTEQNKIKEYISDLIMELYNLKVLVDIEVPIFSDRREIEINNLINEWNNGLLTLRQTITGLSEYTSVIDLNDYDFTVHPDLWDYRKLPEYYDLLNQVDLLALDEVESDINDIQQQQNAETGLLEP